jgi:DnaJ-class molecular chaperone
LAFVARTAKGETMSQVTALLGLEVTASITEIKARFKELSLVHHPDVGGDAERFRVLHEAYLAALEEASEQPCEECQGSGKLTVQTGWRVTRVTCPSCGGSGYPNG